MTERVRIGSEMSSRLPQVPLYSPTLLITHTHTHMHAALASLVASPHACPSGRSLKPLSFASFHECQDAEFKVLQIKWEELSLFCV